MVPSSEHRVVTLGVTVIIDVSHEALNTCSEYRKIRSDNAVIDYLHNMAGDDVIKIARYYGNDDVDAKYLCPSLFCRPAEPSVLDHWINSWYNRRVARVFDLGRW